MIPLNDPRRRHNGNRTVRMPLSGWLAFKKQGWFANENARHFCRIPTNTAAIADRPSTAQLLHDFIHNCGLGAPLQVRKKYGAYVRDMLRIMREKRLRLASFSQHNA